MTADELHALAAKDLARHKPDGDWPVAALYRDGPALDAAAVAALVWQNFVYAHLWAGNLLGVPAGNETHDDWLRAVAEAAVLRRAWQAGMLVRRDLPPKPFDGTYPIEGERRARIRESTGQGGGA